MRALHLSGAACGVIATLAGCVEFDREDQILDVRVVAMQTTPPELLYSPALVFGLPTEATTFDVGVDVLAADPRGGALSFALRLCAEDAEDEACAEVDDDDVNALVATLPEAERDLARLALRPAPVTVPIDLDPATGSTAGLTTAHFDVVIPSSLLAALLPRQPNGSPNVSLTSAFPRFVVDVENVESDEGGVNAETAIKRLPLTLNTADQTMPAAVLEPLLSVYDVSACTAEEQAAPVFVGTANCWRAPTQNENPVVTGFMFDREEAPEEGFFSDDDSDGDGVPDLAPDAGTTAQIKVELGDTITIDPVIARRSFAAYQAFRFDIETSTTVLENRIEDLAIEWFATRGDVGAATTSQQAGFTGTGSIRLGTTWTPPEAAAVGEHDTIIAVVHDQRGGVLVGTIDVEYK